MVPSSLHTTEEIKVPSPFLGLFFALKSIHLFISTVAGCIEQICRCEDKIWLWLKPYRKQMSEPGDFETFRAPVHMDLESTPDHYEQIWINQSLAFEISTPFSEVRDHQLQEKKVMVNNQIKKFPPLHTLRKKE